MRLGLPLDIWDRRGVRWADAARLREQGLVDLIELRLPRSLRPLPRAKQGDLQQARRRLELPVSLHSEVTTFAAHPAPSLRLQLAATLGSTIHLAGELGARVITVHPPLALGEHSGQMPGARWSDHEHRLLSEALSGAPARELFAELLGNMADLGREAGVVLAIENMRPREEGADLNAAGNLCRFARSLGSPGVRVCLDVRKAFGEGLDPAKLIAAEGDLLGNLHAAGLGQRGKPAALGVGSIDWGEVVGALVESGYRGSVVYEGPRRDAETSLSTLRRMVAEALRVT